MKDATQDEVTNTLANQYTQSDHGSFTLIKKCIMDFRGSSTYVVKHYLIFVTWLYWTSHELVLTGMS